MICEVFGFARPEILDPWPYELVLVSPDGPRVRTNQGFAIDGVRPLSALIRKPTRRCARRGQAIPAAAGGGDHRAAAHRRGVRLMSECSEALNASRAGCSTAAGRRRIGCTPTGWPRTSPTSTSTPTCCTSTRVRSSRRPARPRASTCVCTSSRPRRRGGQRRRAAHGGATPHRDGGQAQFVRDRSKPTTARTRWHDARPPRCSDASTNHDRGSDVAPRVDEPAHVRPTVPHGDGHDAVAMAAPDRRILLAARPVEHRLPIELIAQRSGTRFGVGVAHALQAHARRAVAYRRTFCEVL